MEQDLQRMNASMNVVFNKCCCQRWNGNCKPTIDNREKPIKMEKRGLDRVTGIGSCLKPEHSEKHFFNLETRMRISPIQSRTSRQDENF